MVLFPLNTYETVAMDTPASAATSLIVGFPGISLAPFPHKHPFKRLKVITAL
jgi:hypothetical protein